MSIYGSSKEDRYFESKLFDYLDGDEEIERLKICPENIDEYEIDGIDTDDAPDFCDAYFSRIILKDGYELDEDELNKFAEDYTDFLIEKIYQKIY